MPEAPKLLSNEETLALLTQKATETGEDSFWVRVLRRKAPLTDIIARIEQVTLSHLSRPEAWLPQMAGGGSYLLIVGHVSDTSVSVGAPLAYTFKGEVKDPVDVNLVHNPDWPGPRKIIYPEVQPPGFSEFSGGRKGEASAFQTFLESQAKRDARGGGGDPQIEVLKLHLAQMEKEHERREREFREAMDRQARESREWMLKLESRWEHQKPAKPAFDASAIAGLVAAASPVLVKFFESNAQEKVEQQRRMDMLSQQQTELFKTAMSKPAVDPTTEKILDRLQKLAEAKEPSSSLEVLDSMSSAMQTMTSIAMKAATAVAEAQMGGQPQQEGAGLKAFREGMRALENVFKAAAVSKMNQAAKPAPQPQPQLSGHTPPSPAPRPVREPSGFIRPVPAAEKTEAPPAALVDQVIESVRNGTNAKSVAAAIVEGVKNNDESLIGAISEYGSVNDLVARRLGPDFLDESSDNGQYLRTILQEVQAQGNGVFEAQEPEAEEEEGEVAFS